MSYLGAYPAGIRNDERVRVEVEGRYRGGEQFTTVGLPRHTVIIFISSRRLIKRYAVNLS